MRFTAVRLLVMAAAILGLFSCDDKGTEPKPEKQPTIEFLGSMNPGPADPGEYGVINSRLDFGVFTVPTFSPVDGLPFRIDLETEVPYGCSNFCLPGEVNISGNVVTITLAGLFMPEPCDNQFDLARNEFTFRADTGNFVLRFVYGDKTAEFALHITATNPLVSGEAPDWLGRLREGSVESPITVLDARGTDTLAYSGSEPLQFPPMFILDLNQSPEQIPAEVRFELTLQAGTYYCMNYRLPIQINVQEDGATVTLMDPLRPMLCLTGIWMAQGWADLLATPGEHNFRFRYRDKLAEFRILVAADSLAIVSGESDWIIGRIR